MDYSKFDRSAFDSCDGDASKIRELLNELENAVLSDLGNCVTERMGEIVAQLNAQGHQLQRNHELEDPGSVDFCETHGANNCGFRIASDIVISLGYYGISHADFDSSD